MSNRTNKPTIGALAFALRHKELWPADFTWNFNMCETCAIGLAHRLWPQHIEKPHAGFMAQAFGIDAVSARQIFGNGYYSISPVTPEMVADRLDAIA